MSERRKRFATSVARHGLVKTVTRIGYNQLRRLATFEVCRVSYSTQEYTSWSDLPGYRTRAVDKDEFHRRLCAELADVDYRAAFDRGDTCIATFFGDEIVGCTLYTTYPTYVRDGLEFRFPGQYLYNYGSRTAPSHRGKKLESLRWRAGYDFMVKRHGRGIPRIFYVDVMNLESRASYRPEDPDSPLIGYSAYIGIGGRWVCFRSPACEKIGAGFYRDERDEQ